MARSSRSREEQDRSGRTRARRLFTALALIGWVQAAHGVQAQTPPAAVAVATPAETVRPARYGYEVVASWPHDPTAFTQGLEYVDGVLLESTGRENSGVRRVRLEDGVVTHRQALEDRYFGEGLTVVGDRVFSLTWTHGVGFIWARDDLEPLGQFTYAGEGWGLTHDATRLILSDGEPRLRFLDPVTLTETGSVPVTFMGQPLGRLNELEFIDGEVFANIWQTDFIVRINPDTGVVTGVIDLTGLLGEPVANPSDEVLNGIAWDPEGRRLFVTGKHWPRLFEIRLTGPE
ncbi:MAG: glutaminyl-peptide cyclotransferase [Caulobacteraceae bacterium]|nr:glutaminyl-peptide cyclotransferase [Caulobacteraceae bacterium]